MHQTSHALISAILTSDKELSLAERTSLTSLLDPSALLRFPAANQESVTLSQKEAAAKLGVNRTTIWRLKGLGILKPCEISPGYFRYRLDDIQKLTEVGYRHLLGFRRKLAA